MMLGKTERTVINESKFNPESILWAQAGDFITIDEKVLVLMLKKHTSGLSLPEKQSKGRNWRLLQP
jgi:hypothetical protein